MPSFKPPNGGLRVLGNARAEHLIKTDEELDSLDWSDWQVLCDMSKSALPTNLGVYRIQAMPL